VLKSIRVYSKFLLLETNLKIKNISKFNKKIISIPYFYKTTQNRYIQFNIKLYCRQPRDPRRRRGRGCSSGGRRRGWPRFRHTEI